MDLRHLKSFLVVAEELNIGRAAVRLHISQPPLTRQIQQLEESLGAQLLVRNNRGVELTDAGRLLVEEARAILSLAEQAAERTHMAAQGKLGRIDVGIFGSAILDVIPRSLARFRKLYPGVRIVLHPMTKTEQIDALRERRLTVGFNRIVPVEPDIVVEPILKENLVVAFDRHHEFARLREVRLKDVVHQPLIIYPSAPRPSFADDVVALIRNEGVQPRIVQEVVDVLTAISLVAAGFGVCVAPESAANLRLPGVGFRQLKANPPVFTELSCLYRKDDPSPILAAFMKIVRDAQRLLPERTAKA